MPEAAFTDMRNYLQAVRELPDVRLTDDEAAILLADGKLDEVYGTLQKIVPYVVQRYVYDAHIRENFQDLIQEGNLAVWKCIGSWQPHRGMSLASWAFMYARKAVIAEMRKDLRYVSNHIYRDLDEDIESTDLDSDLHDDGRWEDEQEAAAICRGLRRKLSDRDKRLWDLLLEGHTQQHIAEYLGLSQSRVSRITASLYENIRLAGA